MSSLLVLTQQTWLEANYTPKNISHANLIESVRHMFADVRQPITGCFYVEKQCECVVHTKSTIELELSIIESGQMLERIEGKRRGKRDTGVSFGERAWVVCLHGEVLFCSPSGLV